MAKLSKEDVLKLARLAKLHLSDDEVEEFRKEISSILGYVEQLREINLENVKPTYQVTGLTNVMRSDDIINYGQNQIELLKNAPQSESGQIKVRKIL
ncbi:Asp-tRNA(Asn)/Glu-tRNA(Gln) amidotransferase subunit GatC [Candidatus Saccharibacteria bacterium]|nr:Asp-tRNA(Asn)/Glu-tRNA(Gln) amidotransferase subunit GatC [Candidatus Saccharibacteria bacterium]